jgi:hypothetical protein
VVITYAQLNAAVLLAVIEIITAPLNVIVKKKTYSCVHRVTIMREERIPHKMKHVQKVVMTTLFWPLKKKCGELCLEDASFEGSGFPPRPRTVAHGHERISRPRLQS